MLNITAFMKSDVFWSLFAMPIGLLICFGPALVVWLLSGFDEPSTEIPKTAEVQAKH
jgi:hypothetical protein